MTKQVCAVLLVVGGALAVVGLILGLTPVHHGGIGCGSAFGGGFKQDVAAVYQGGSPFACQDARAGRKTVALALLIPGVLIAGAGGGWLVRERATQNEPATVR